LLIIHKVLLVIKCIFIFAGRIGVLIHIHLTRSCPQIFLILRRTSGFSFLLFFTWVFYFSSTFIMISWWWANVRWTFLRICLIVRCIFF
jgi:hypothetical protein